jgi:uncharacterized repeat protein (TIGR03837 family)
MLWDLFCRVIDNFGDVGVCWRLAADLATRGESVRLWLDDPSALRWMAPGGQRGVELVEWGAAVAPQAPGDVVVEAFGCDPPAWFVERMAAAARPPVWINLEYLSAEGFAERSHGLPSPRLSGPGAGLVKWFFYPGFTAATGGLIRESDLLQRQQAFDPAAWLAARGIERRPDERLVSLFSYPNTALPELIERLAEAPTLLLASAGAAAEQVAQVLGPQHWRGALRSVALPWLSQVDYDHLLWACDLNFVRGEDSFVRAQWAARPFVWHVYPQDDGAHLVKLQAFAGLYLAAAPPALASAWSSLAAAWNGAGGRLELPPLEAWQRHALTWRRQLLQLPDLVTGLSRFAREKG